VALIIILRPIIRVLNAPRDFIAGPEPNTILIVEYGNHIIRKLNTQTNELTIFAGDRTTDNIIENLAINSSIANPRGIAKDKNGHYFVSTEAGYIRRILPTGQIVEYAGVPLGTGELSDVAFMDEMVLSDPSDIVIDNNNDLMYIADTGNHRIVQIDMTEGIARTVAGNTLCDPNALDEGKPALESSLCSPEKLALDSNGNLLILDPEKNSIRRLNISSNTEGELYYAGNEGNNSELKRLPSGEFELTSREGDKVFFNAQGKMTSAIDRVGNTTSLIYENNLLTEIQFSTGQSMSMTYSNGLLQTIEDVAGKLTQFSYEGNELVSVTYPDTSSESFEYNSLGIMTKSFDKRGAPTQFIYNNQLRLTQTIAPEGESTKIADITSASMQGGELNNLDSVADIFTDANENDIAFNKDTSGYVQTITDSKGRISTIERDNIGRPLKITKYNNAYVEFQYNEFGDLTYKYDSEADTGESFIYNDFGDLLEYINPLSNKMEKTYLANGLLHTTKDYLGNTITRSYFDDGLVKTITNNLNESTAFEYNLSGNLIKRISPEGEETVYTRDDAGNIIEKTNANGTTTLYTYDDFNRLTSVATGITGSDPIGKLTTYQYDFNGNLTKIIDPKGNQTLFEYDLNNRLTKKTTMLGQITQLAYDGNNNVIWEQDPNGNIKTFEYDSDNQLTKKLLPDNNYLMEYDLDGNMTLISDSDSAISFSYEKIADEFYVSSTTAESDYLQAITLDYNYDKIGNRKAMLTPYGDFTYNYDASNRLTNLTNHKNEMFTFGYDSSNRITQITRPNGVITTHSFDKNSFLASIIHSKSGSDISTFNYTRDFIGNKTSKTTGRGIASYGYDAESQLTSNSDSEAGINEVFEYDELGNRLVDHNGNYQYDAKSQRLMQDWQYTYQYDNNGNLIQRTSKSNIATFTQYTYSSENQLIKVEDYENNVRKQTVTYAHDALGRRINKTIIDNQNVSSEINYLYDGQEILAEYDDSSLLAVHTHSTLRTDDTLASDIKTTKLANNVGSYFYLKDSLGSIIDITDSNGNFIQHYVYSSFGEKLKITDNANNEIAPVVKTSFGFTNREYDVETGLMHYRARVYMPEIGRFMQEDPHPGEFKLPKSLTSRYVYSLNNPINRLDPSGEMSFEDIVFTVAIIALTAYTGGLAGAYVGSAVGGGAAGAVAGGFAGAIVGGVTGHFAGGFLNVALGRGSFRDGAFEGAQIGVTTGAIAGAFAGYSAEGAGADNCGGSKTSNLLAMNHSAVDRGVLSEGLINMASDGQAELIQYLLRGPKAVDTKYDNLGTNPDKELKPKDQTPRNSCLE
jgi:RHS repeat-associated protein